MRLDDWQKTSNKNLLFNVEMLCEAINAGKQVRMTYYHYDVDKRLHPNGKPKTVNPYQVFSKNGFYYLACSFVPYRTLAFCRVDRMGQIETLDTDVQPIVDEDKTRYQVGQSFNRLPYLFAEEPTWVTFEADKWMTDHVIDWFGYDFAVKPYGDTYRFTVKVGERSMLYWVMQFSTAVKVVAPQSLVNTIRDTLDKMKEMYKDGD